MDQLKGYETSVYENLNWKLENAALKPMLWDEADDFLWTDEDVFIEPKTAKVKTFTHSEWFSYAM